MATLVLSAVGNAIGGPIGGNIGAFVGQQIDRELFEGPSREGPRLEELAVTTSSYGQPIPRHHGRMRAAGSIIWATDLKESSETSGGKGQPDTTTYSYSTSFAVALASRPIASLGRVWADGNLLRGAAGDLKVGGTLRLHRGTRDQQPDPLIASHEGSGCPAFRGCAYAVFEDLQLADFGNRLPALTFEIIADDGEVSFAQMIEPLVPGSEGSVATNGLDGYSLKGGTLDGVVSSIDGVYPLNVEVNEDRLKLSVSSAAPADLQTLPPAIAAEGEGDFGGPAGTSRQRSAGSGDAPRALRYYDTARDYQPGVQRAEGRSRSGRNRIVDFPGALEASVARGLANDAAQRASWRREKLSWRIAELDPALSPGTIVRAPGLSGLWRITASEWRETGVELELDRLPPVDAAQPSGDAGKPGLPTDEALWETWLEAFELPWDGRGSSEARAIYVAASAGGSGWSGATIYARYGEELEPIATTNRRRSTGGALAQPLASAQSMLFDAHASVEINLVSADMTLSPSSIAGIARGANRVLIGEEIVQFGQAEQIGETRWRIAGLLRGRGGTEFFAQSGHPAGARVVLLDETLVPLDPGVIPPFGSTTISALGRGDEEPVDTVVSGIGTTLRPLAPVHPQSRVLTSGALELCWTRRARGAWEWIDEVDTPLVEQSELYRVGLGDTLSPDASWDVTTPSLLLDTATLAELSAAHTASPLWVRQVGSHAQSLPTLLAYLPG